MIGFVNLKTTVLQPQNMDMHSSFPRMYDSADHKGKMKDSEQYSRDTLSTIVSLKF